MNWLGELVQKEVKKSDTVLDIGCGIMAPTMDTCPNYPHSRLKCRFIVGVDAHVTYLEQIKDKEKVCVVCRDVSTGLPIFVDKSFDIVLMLDILEHLFLHEAEYLITEAERIARKKIIIYTPREYFDNRDKMIGYYPHHGAGYSHPYNGHKCLVDYRNLEASGYFVTFPEPDGDTYGVKIL